MLRRQEEIPDLINNYFSEIGPKQASEIINITDADNIIIGQPNQQVFEFEEFTLPELTDNIKKISIYKSSGITNISTRFFKDVTLYIPHVFLHIYNAVRLSGDFPDSWKIATVVPLPKNNDPQNPSELRPIPLLPIVGTILEKLIYKQSSTFLENLNYLTKMQHGFPKRHSTTSATSKFVDDIILNLDKGYYSLAVFLDVKKAFDTVDHAILIKKLKHSGAGNNVIRLFTNYLSNRKQTVLYNGQLSDIKTLRTGVPQGSTLGPLLFLLYINDLPNILSKSLNLMFADDTVLCHCHSSFEMLLRELQTDIDSVFKWCQQNYITLNITKSQDVQFSYMKHNF